MKQRISKIFSCLLALVMLVTSLTTFGISASAEENYIDNSSLLPKWYAATAETVDERGTPDWVQEMIMMGCRIATATPEGTFKSAIKILDHCAEMGVNALWINPVNDNKEYSHGYFNLGPHTIDPRLTGELGYDEEWRQTDYEAGWKVFKEFVDEAHKRNIRIILDVVSWGTMEGELTEAHPDWYQLGSGLGGADSKNFIYDNEEAQEWFAKAVADVVEKTGVDGLRYDMEPQKFGYGVATEIRKILAGKGIYIANISEASNERGITAYDFEQYGVTGPGISATTYPQNLFIEGNNIVQCVKTGEYIGSLYSQNMGTGGEYQYYTMMLSCHDFYDYAVKGSKISFGYQAIYAPFIPVWYMGEQWNNSEVMMKDCGRGNSSLLFGVGFDWTLLDQPENRAFYESVKQMIAIRRSYPEIFNYWPENHRETNICEVEVIGQDHLISYARYAGNKGLLILPNDNVHETDGEYKVYVPLADMELDYYESYTVKNLMTGKVVAEGTAADVRSFKTTVEYGDVDVYEVIAGGERNVPVEEEPDDEPEEDEDEDLSDEELDEIEPDFEDNNVGGEEDEEEQQVVVVTKKRRRKKKQDSFPWGIVAGGAAAAVVAAGGATGFIILKKRKKKEDEVTGEASANDTEN